MHLDRKALLEKARHCFNLEAEAIRLTSDRLTDEFVTVIEVIQDAIVSKHKLIFTGVGKNVPVCQKLVGTFNSTGVPTTFLDPNQALHGDLGLCVEGDVAFLISNSGETEELLRVIALVKRLGVTTVAITQMRESTLARNSDHVLLYHAEREACPLGLAPTASTTAALALGDALAMVYLDVRGFSREDFARYHPAGSLGKALLLRVSEIMRTGARFASLPDTASVRDALIAMTHAKCGTIALTLPSGKLAGVFSDGDFRRASLKDEYILLRKASDYMTCNPKTIAANSLAVDALKIFEKSSVNDLIAIDAEGNPVGLVDGQDLPKLKIV
ncbi:MAG: KpsF/GutQ family sugar-phosphate isomerase [Verrucomicrobiota bacterium]|nr:KpsF/GutQ family sugar-phosphate isomerase [Verrucomicrobiota bacterium]